MNNKTQSKHKFNSVDLIIVFLIAIIVALVAFIFVFRGSLSYTGIVNVGAEKSEICYAVEFGRVREEMIHNLTLEDTINDSVKNIEIGKVVGVYIGDSEFVGVNDEGIAVSGSYPGYKSLVAIVRADAILTDYSYNINGYEVEAGKEISVCSPNFAATGYCLSAKSVKSEEDVEEFVKNCAKLVFYAEPDQADQTEGK